jgi:propionyl-CoA synthetase
MWFCKNARSAENRASAVGRDATPTGYVETYSRSIERSEEFWAEAAEAIDWEHRWDRVLDVSRPPFYRWFSGAKLNTCWNALDRHVVAGRGDRNALIWDSPVTGQIGRFSYRELRDEVSRVAGALAGLGVIKGDRVLIYMPMVPEAAMAMLACARIGAIHSVVFGGFAAHELATRIDDAKPRVILSASCGIEVNRIIPYKPLLDAAIAEARTKPEHCVILQRPMCHASLMASRDRDWHEIVAAARPADWVPVLATDPLYILYTSGRPASPRGWCATMAAMPWRCTGRCATSTGSILTRCSGRLRTSAGWLVTPTSSMPRCCWAAPRSCTRASRSARPTPAPSGGS